MESLRSMSTGTPVHIYQGETKYTGTLRDVDDDTVEIRHDGGHVRQYPAHDIALGNVRIEVSDSPSENSLPFVDPAIVSLSASPQLAAKRATSSSSTRTASPSGTDVSTTSSPQSRKLPMFQSYNINERNIVETVYVTMEKKTSKAPTKPVSSAQSSPPINAHKPDDVTSSEDTPVQVVQSSSSPAAKSIHVPANLIPPKARLRARGANSATPTPNAQMSAKESATGRSEPKVESKTEPKTTTAAPAAEKRQTQAPNRSNQSVDNEESPKAETKKAVPKILARNQAINSGIRTKKDKINCPVVSLEIMENIINVSASEAGCTRAMMAENAGHCASSVALKFMGIQGNKKPNVVIMVGNNRVGSYGLAAARHLSNRGCRVHVYLAFPASGETVQEVADQKKCATCAGVQIVNAVQDLPEEEANLVMDALMVCQFPKDLRMNETRSAMDWINNQSAPVMSLDFPSGINKDGYPFHVSYCVHPKLTLAFGVPQEGCRSEEVTGNLYLANIGIPRMCLKDTAAGHDALEWGSDFVMQLEYCNDA